MPGKYHGKSSQLFIAGYDITPIITKIEWSDDIEMDAYAVADGTGGYHNIPGIIKGSVKVDGIFNDVYQGVLNNLLGSITNSQLIAVLGETAGDVAIAIEAVKEHRYSWPLTITDANRLTAEFSTEDSPVDVGQLLQAKTTVTENGNGTDLDNGGTSTNGLKAYLQVFACGADDALVVKVQSDDNADFTSPTDLVTFTAANGVTTEVKSATGTIERYLRASWSGAAPYSGTFAVIIKR